MEDPITRAEYEEYQKRMEQEDHRQNRRIEQLEEKYQADQRSYGINRKTGTEC